MTAVSAPPTPPPTAVLEEYAEGLPQSFALEQNHPNPFNSETVIRFALPEASLVELAVYNLTGQKVATLVRGERPAGMFAVRWDGRDEAGGELASGIYLPPAGRDTGRCKETPTPALSRREAAIKDRNSSNL